MTFPSHLQYLNGSLSKSLSSFEVYFREIYSRRVLVALGQITPYILCWEHFKHFLTNIFFFMFAHSERQMTSHSNEKSIWNMGRIICGMCTFQLRWAQLPMQNKDGEWWNIGIRLRE